MKTLTTTKRLLNKTNAIWLTLSILLIVLSKYQIIPASIIEVLGFISGALCVWLVVKQNIWNWPIGIINAISFLAQADATAP